MVDCLDERPTSIGLVAHLGTVGFDPIGQRGNVPHSQSISPSQQDPGQRDGVTRPFNGPQPGMQICNVWEVQEAPERTNFDRYLLRLQRVPEEVHVLVLAEDHCNVAPPQLFLLMKADYLGRDPLCLVDCGAEIGRRHVAASGGGDRVEPCDTRVIVHTGPD